MPECGSFHFETCEELRFARATERLVLSLFTILRKNPQKVGLRPGQVALTFDDGPNLEGNVTPNLLNVLHNHNVKAAFCVVGKQAQRHPETVRRMHYSGHLLVNHTQNHVHPVRQSTQTLVEEIEACDVSIGSALGIARYRSQFFRVPFGIVTVAVRRATKRLGVTPVLLSHYGWDTRVGPQNYADVVDALIANAKQFDGGMYVLHDGSLCRPRQDDSRDWNLSTENRVWVPDAVDRIIRELKAAGMSFVLPRDNNQKQKSRTAA